MSNFQRTKMRPELLVTGEKKSVIGLKKSFFNKDIFVILRN